MLLLFPALRLRLRPEGPHERVRGGDVAGGGRELELRVEMELPEEGRKAVRNVLGVDRSGFECGDRCREEVHHGRLLVLDRACREALVIVISMDWGKGRALRELTLSRKVAAKSTRWKIRQGLSRK